MSTQGYGATGLAGGPFTVSNPPPGKRFGSFINGRKQIIWLQARTTLAAAMSAARSGNPVTPEDVAVPEVDEQELPSGSSSALGGKCGPVASATGDSRPTATAGTDPAFKLVNALATAIVDWRASLKELIKTDEQFEKAMRAGKGEREQVCKLTQKVMEAVWAVKAECEPDNIREGERAICDPDCSFAVI